MVEDTEKVDIPSYLGVVSGKIFSSLSDGSNQFRLVTDIADGALERAQAQGLAIIINEFITNSFKYAFKGSGTITLKLRFEATTAVLDLIDDGPGISDDAPAGLGLKIIEAIAAQVGGTAEWPSGKGTRLRIVLPRSGR
jgi:two-component sensor histidine kinase